MLAATSPSTSTTVTITAIITSVWPACIIVVPKGNLWWSYLYTTGAGAVFTIGHGRLVAAGVSYVAGMGAFFTGKLLAS